jgi:catechol 2,3-dioxygenase-like lactoylglutathione lyase family enzyme
MRRLLTSAALFVAGTVVGILIMQSGLVPQAKAQQTIPGIRLNHVGVYVKDWNESWDFYTKTMGFREAFVNKDKDGKPTLAYLQINKDTFLEMAPATAERPAGLSHLGIWADDLNATVATLRMRGVKLNDPRAASSKSPLTNVMDPNGIRVELLEFPAESLQRKAMDAWK